MGNISCTPSQEGSEPFRGAPSPACAKDMDWKPEALPKEVPVRGVGHTVQ